MSSIDELRAEERKELNALFLEEYSNVQNESSNLRLPKPMRVTLDSLFVLRHQFFHTGFINMYLQPDRTTDVEAFLRAKYTELCAIANSYPEYKYALAMDPRFNEVLDEIKRCGKETTESMRKDTFAANLERCSELRMELDDAVMDLFNRIDQDCGTRYTPSIRLMNKEDRVAHNTLSTIATPYESRGQRAQRSVANDLLSQKQLTQIKIGVGLIDREIKNSQAEFNARKKVQGRGLLPDTETALVQLYMDRHMFHTTGSMRVFTNPDEQNNTVDSINCVISVLNAQATNKNCLPVSFDFNRMIEELKQIGEEAREKGYEEPYFTQAVENFCEKKDEIDMAIREYLEATDKEFGTRIAPTCNRREGVDAVSITKENIRTVLEKKKEQERWQTKNEMRGTER